MRIILTAILAALPFLAATPGKDAVESFQIRNYKYGQLLRPEDANSADGTRLVLYPAQPWKCMTWKLHPAGDARYQVQNHFTAKTFAASGGGAEPAVLQVPFGPDGSPRPVWHFTKLPDGRYTIADGKSGKVLTAIPAGRSIRVVLAPWQEKPEQRWELIRTDPAALTM